jgi:hypothetical protein
MPLFTMPEWRRPQSERVFSFSARNLFRRRALISFNMHTHKHTHHLQRQLEPDFQRHGNNTKAAL